MVGDTVYLRLEDGSANGPFIIVARFPPKSSKDTWQYDIQDVGGTNHKYRVGESSISMRPASSRPPQFLRSPQWAVDDLVYLRVGDGKTSGPFFVTKCHPPDDTQHIHWRYDIKGKNSNIIYNYIDGDSLVSPEVSSLSPTRSTNHDKMSCRNCECQWYVANSGAWCPECRSAGDVISW